MKRVALLGLGLMGGSLGLALGRRCPAVVRAAYARRPATREAALAAGAADAVFDSPAAAAAGADLVVACVPVLSIPPLIAAALPGVSPGARVTDVGSTKATLAAALTGPVADAGGVFVGSHPIAGSEATGLDAARADLYAGAMTVVTPLPSAPPAAVADVVALWEAVGSRTACLAPEAHDRLLARTSHLPHLAAAALVRAVCRGDNVGAFCGGGFRDTTRVAGGSEEIWQDIVETNRAAVADELDALRAELDRLSALVREGSPDDLRRCLAEARRLRAAALAAGGEEHP